MFHQSDTQKLLEEIDRYLAAVDLFRAESCEPTWRPEIHAEIAVLNPTARAAAAALRHPHASDHEVAPSWRVTATCDVLSAS